MTDEYWASHIKVLEWLEPVRQRPGMYIWSTDIRWLYHMIWEIVDNGIDEAMAWFCKNITLVFSWDWWVTVFDDGRWIPVDTHPKTGKSALETVFTVLHAWGKFNKDVYKVSWWLHGVWASVVNALSEKLIVRVHKNWKLYQQEYSKWIPSNELECIWETDLSGTTVAFKPDMTIFETSKYTWSNIATKFRQSAYLSPWVTLSIIEVDTVNDTPILDFKDLVDLTIIQKERYFFSSWIRVYLKNLIWDKKTTFDQFFCAEDGKDVFVEIALSYVNENNDNILSFANNIPTHDWWSHLNWFRSWLLKAVCDFTTDNNLKDNKIWEFQPSDVMNWLYAIISIKLPEPQFEWQTKWRLWNNYIRKEVETIIYKFMKTKLEENFELWERIINRVKLNAKARVAARLARETVMRKNVMSTWVLPWKLSDCSNKNREWTELFIVEGNSAGWSAKQARDSSIQAILPLRGKPLNTERIAFDKLLDNTEIKSLTLATWCWLKDLYNEEMLRYDKIVLMTDADVDGAHIRTLLLTFFYRYMRPLIENWHLYIAVAPLYKFKQWKKELYIFPPQEDVFEAMRLNWFDSKKTDIQRYKGLWEMNPQQLWDTTMDPEKRLMLQVTIEDAQNTDNLFSILMWTDIPSRRQFILTHAKNIKNLDI